MIFRQWIQRTGRLIKNRKKLLPRPYKHPGDRHLLCFTTGKHCAVLSELSCHIGIRSIRKTGKPLFKICLLQSFKNALPVTNLHFVHQYILCQRRTVDLVILKNRTNAFSVFSGAVLTYIVSAVTNASIRHIIQMHQQLDEGCLAGTILTNKCHLLARFDRQ